MHFVTERPFLAGRNLGGRNPFFLIAGPCTLESIELGLTVAERVKAVCDELGIFYIFKASFDKANRSSLDSVRGPGLEKGIQWLAEIKSQTGLPILTDIHSPEQAGPVGEVADILQIPAFLCRQTDLLVAAAQTNAWVNVKKGQFIAPEDTASIVEKIKAAGSDRYLLTERGASFGYHNLVADFRSSNIIRSLDIPFIFDATHSVQYMGGGKESSGSRNFIPVLSRAAAAAGVEGVFMEVHPDPPKAASDKATQIYLQDAAELIRQIASVDALVKGMPQWQITS